MKLNIGDYLDLDEEKTYMRSDGSVIMTVDVDILVNAIRLDERNRINKYLDDKLGYDYSGVRPYEILTGLDFRGRFNPHVKEKK